MKEKLGRFFHWFGPRLWEAIWSYPVVILVTVAVTWALCRVGLI